MNDNSPETELDVTGLLCPLPVLKARKKLGELPVGAVLRVTATDPMAMLDMPHFCQEQGHGLLAAEKVDERFVFRIRKGAAPASSAE
jgi:tRNA 2-thiouridine synthesizing protein A